MYQTVPDALTCGDEDKGEGVLPQEKREALDLDVIDTFSNTTICCCSNKDLNAEVK